jgi:hypothetical protein
MKYRGFIVCAVLAAVVHTGFAQERNLYFDLGVGSGFIRYGGELDALASDMEDSGIERSLAVADMSIGKAIADNLYIDISSIAFSDRFKGESDIFADHVDWYTVLYGVGVKYYPLPSALHLQLGADAGLVWMMFTSTMSDFQIGRSPFGFGGRISVSYDFDSDMTGPAFLLGAQLMANIIENKLGTGFSIFAKFAYKTN